MGYKKCRSTSQTSLNALFIRTKQKTQFGAREFFPKHFSIILLKLRQKKHLEIRVVAAIIDDAPFLQSLKKNIDFGGVIFKNALCYNSEGDSPKPPFFVF